MPGAALSASRGPIIQSSVRLQEVGAVFESPFVGKGMKGQSCQVACPPSHSTYMPAQDSNMGSLALELSQKSKGQPVSQARGPFHLEGPTQDVGDKHFT